jgi:hypothetical protein
MRWIRQRVRGCAWLALFALAVHITLSFGHVHADLPAPVFGAEAAGTQAPASDHPAPQPFRSPVAFDFCAICANIGVLSSLVLPTPAALTPPLQSTRVRFALAPSEVPFVPPRSFNQARGPPSV